MKTLNMKFDKLIAKYPLVLTIGQLLVWAMTVIAVVFVVNQI